MRVEAEEALKEVSEAEDAKHEDDEEMSSYEKERLANIKRNNAFLLNLGIVDTVQPAVTPKVSQISRNVALCLVRMRASESTYAGDLCQRVDISKST